MNRPLTNQQQSVYDFIREKILSRGYGPTVREIGEHMNIKSPNGVMCHLRALERKAMIIRAANKSRAIELTEPISRIAEASLPIYGATIGGSCVLSSVASGKIDFSTLAAPDRFALRVRDDSLMDYQVRSGDTLIIQRQMTAAHGQLAIVRTGDADTCLRFWMTDNGRVRLQPANHTHSPTVVEHAEVLGVVIGVLRDLRPLSPAR